MTTEHIRTYLKPIPAMTVAAVSDPALLNFHQRLPGYAPTPLVHAPHLAAALGVQDAWIKDEANRLGLPAYKILGASWAVYRELETIFGPFTPWATLEGLAQQLRAHLPLTLVTATDGNHGRAVARMARWLGLEARILVPENMVHARIQAIETEGAQVEVVHGTYDEAVAAAAHLRDDQYLVISDTAWEGYERVPAWVVEGYGTIFHEIDQQLGTLGRQQPDVVAVQMGVGSLAMAVVQHYRTADRVTQVVGVEPLRAACVLQSLEAGKLTEIPGPHTSIMAGLNCGNTSPLAWPYLQGGLSAAVAISDTQARAAMCLLAQEDVVSGESGAAGAGGLLALCVGNDAEEIRTRLGITPESTVLVISTEGATDPEAYARIVQESINTA